jgi:AbrB family looped-hinge helix DNA binding protein
MEKADVVVVSSKGQVVIPQSMRQKLGIGARSKLLVYPYEDVLIMKKLDVRGAERSLEAVFRKVAAKTTAYGVLSNNEINDLVQRYRHGKGQSPV